MRTEKPRAWSRAPSDAEAMPLPREETTPPVMNTYRVMDDPYTEPNRVGGSPHIQSSRMRQPQPRFFLLPRYTGGSRGGCLVIGNRRSLRRGRRRRGGRCRRGWRRVCQQPSAASHAGRAAVHQRQGQRQGHENRRQDGGGAGQQVGGAPAGHERAHALRRANTQSAALAALDQHNANQRDRDEQVDDKQDGGHTVSLGAGRSIPFPPSPAIGCPNWVSACAGGESRIINAEKGGEPQRAAEQKATGRSREARSIHSAALRGSPPSPRKN